MSTPRYSIGVACDHLITMKNGVAAVERNQFIGVKNNTIAVVERLAPTHHREACNQWIDAKGHVVLPGLINGHTHLAMSLFRGLEDDLHFHDWLFKRILPLEGELVREDFVRVGTRLSALECIRFGVTTVNDMYFYARVVAEELDRAGLRGLVAQVWSNYPMPEDEACGKDKTKLFNELREYLHGHPRLQAALGPHAPYSCSDEILREIVQLSTQHQAKIHIHVSESEREVLDSQAQHSATPPERLHRLGILNSRMIAAHGVHLTPADIELFAREQASVVYNPDSNLKLGSGIAPITQLLAAGIAVAFGTDGAASNNDLSLFGAMDVGTKLQKLAGHDTAAMTAAQALRCATWDGARALGLLDQVGSIEVGKRADLITVSLQHPHLQPVHQVMSHLVYAAQGLEVENVMVDGQILLKNGVHTSLDAQAIYAEAEIHRARIQTALERLP